eukprot:11734613-Alexandrium_andersonii.AAC.1
MKAGSEGVNRVAGNLLDEGRPGAAVRSELGGEVHLLMEAGAEGAITGAAVGSGPEGQKRLLA